MEEIKILFEKNEYKKADDILHTLKGVSGAIGAEKFRYKVIELRQYILDEKDEDISVKFQEVCECYTKTLEEIDKILDDYNTKNNKEINNSQSEKDNALGNIQGKGSIIDKLKNSMEEGNIEAADIFNENREQIKEYLSEKEFEMLKNAIESYDMYEGLNILKAGDKNV